MGHVRVVPPRVKEPVVEVVRVHVPLHVRVHAVGHVKAVPQHAREPVVEAARTLALMLTDKKFPGV